MPGENAEVVSVPTGKSLACFRASLSDSARKESTCNSGDLGWEDPLEKAKATHSSILPWRIPWTVQSMGVAKTQQSDFHWLVLLGEFQYN